ncbi:zinc finger and SCAN domain-containing protein 5A-like [Saccostrea echinata]|uniref:zinc finger and SCAN domain-containing protein 5A-like n=1 Tax=Saccostrea echinata TaxID=191078 RepID=UPI002A801EAD|nr:zinc finger and SCAN domain-containing protein 5A-like [Saccostrea echinata]
MTVVERHVSVTFLPVPHSEMQLLPPQQGKINHKERSNVEESKDDLCLREIEAGEQASPKKRQQLSGPSKETKEEPELELEEDTEKSNGKRPALEEDSAEPNKKHRPLKCERCKQLMLSNNLELSNDISCEFCSKEFDCYCALEFHKVTIHIEKKPHCALCCKVITGPKLSEHLQSHGLTSQDLMITCDDCNIYGYKWSNRTFFKKNTFCTHLQGKDTLYNNVLIKCPKCPAEFDRLEFFESHREKMH